MPNHLAFTSLATLGHRVCVMMYGYIYIYLLMCVQGVTEYAKTGALGGGIMLRHVFVDVRGPFVGASQFSLVMCVLGVEELNFHYQTWL